MSVENKKLAMMLLRADNEDDVVSVLRNAGYWNDEDSWSLFGGRENNYSIIGNQQANPVFALVEKIVNSVDAVLMRECLRAGIDPESKGAPQSIAEALERYFEIKEGNLANIGAQRRTELANNIGLIASGLKTRPNYIVFDRGEGQTPKMMSSTFLSLAESNKLRIPFVQGKFNMGGSGVLRFCGDRHLNLVISRRDPEIIIEDDETSSSWGVTIIRREDPSGSRKNSVYTYLAPEGLIPTFEAAELSLPKFEGGTQEIDPLCWGSIIKMYEYEMPGGLKTNILFDLYNEISLLLPRAGLPVRFYERRDYSGHSLETTLAGLNVRLEEDKRDNVEPGFPTGFDFNALGEQFTGTIFAFQKESAGKYKNKEGILFTSNGQTHGYLPQSFFTRNKVGMSYITDSLLVIVECDRISRRAREVLFMNSRDRLSEGELRREIERSLEEILRSHPGLRELRERRRRETVDEKLSGSKPLKDVLNEILRKSPALTALFTQGADIKNPFKSRLVAEDEDFEGVQHPTFFKLFPGHEEKDCHVNLRFRLQFETDVVNDYFERDRYPGRLVLEFNGNESTDYVRNLWNGTATLTIPLPHESNSGDEIHGQVIVEDDTLLEPIRNRFVVHVVGPLVSTGGGNTRRRPRGNGNGDRVDIDQLQLPQVSEVREDDWDRFEMDKFSALKVINTGENGYDFFLNMDNVFLRTELKSISKEVDSKLLEAQFKYGQVLLGLTILKDHEAFLGQEHSSNGEVPIEEIVLAVSKSISPVLIPMIEALGSLRPDDLIENDDDLEYE